MAMLKFTSCMAPSMDETCRSIADYLGARLGCDVEFIGDIAWTERERRFDSGEIQVCWICGLPYVWKSAAQAPIGLLAAPVMLAPRYAGRAVYYSDIVVHAQSDYREFSDLRGCRWVYNEPRSHSGYNVVRDHLARLGATQGYFGETLESGAHQTSIRWIAERRVDGSAIDSTVLELELARTPELTASIRIIGALGPSPMPPWVTSHTMQPSTRRALKRALLAMHFDPKGAEILAQVRCAKFVAVRDSAYNPIRRMAANAGRVVF